MRIETYVLIAHKRHRIETEVYNHAFNLHSQENHQIFAPYVVESSPKSKVQSPKSKVKGRSVKTQNSIASRPYPTRNPCALDTCGRGALHTGAVHLVAGRRGHHRRAGRVACTHVWRRSLAGSPGARHGGRSLSNRDTLERSLDVANRTLWPGCYVTRHDGLYPPLR